MDAEHPSTVNKIKDLFRKELKRRKLEKTDADQIDVPPMFKQGVARIVYTTRDEDLMVGEDLPQAKSSPT